MSASKTACVNYCAN